MGTRSLNRLYEDENFIVDIEIVNDKPFLHVKIEGWNVRVARKGFQLLFAIQSELREKGFSAFYACTQNNEFANMYGGECVDTILYDNIPYGVYKWELV